MRGLDTSTSAGRTVCHVDQHPMSCSGSAQCEGADTVRPTVLPGACVHNLVATITWAEWSEANDNGSDSRWYCDHRQQYAQTSQVHIIRLAIMTMFLGVLYSVSKVLLSPREHVAPVWTTWRPTSCAKLPACQQAWPLPYLYKQTKAKPN